MAKVAKLLSVFLLPTLMIGVVWVNVLAQSAEENTAWQRVCNDGVQAGGFTGDGELDTGPDIASDPDGCSWAIAAPDWDSGNFEEFFLFNSPWMEFSSPTSIVQFAGSYRMNTESGLIFHGDNARQFCMDVGLEYTVSGVDEISWYQKYVGGYGLPPSPVDAYKHPPLLANEWHTPENGYGLLENISVASPGATRARFVFRFNRAVCSAGAEKWTPNPYFFYLDNLGIRGILSPTPTPTPTVTPTTTPAMTPTAIPTTCTYTFSFDSGLQGWHNGAYSGSNTTAVGGQLRFGQTSSGSYYDAGISYTEIANQAGWSSYNFSNARFEFDVAGSVDVLGLSDTTWTYPSPPSPYRVDSHNVAGTYVITNASSGLSRLRVLRHKNDSGYGYVSEVRVSNVSCTATTPSPTITPTVTVTGTATPTPINYATQTPAPSPTGCLGCPETATPGPTWTPEPTWTPWPTPVPGSTWTPQPTWTPEPLVITATVNITVSVDITGTTGGGSGPGEGWTWLEFLAYLFSQLLGFLAFLIGALLDFLMFIVGPLLDLIYFLIWLLLKIVELIGLLLWALWWAFRFTLGLITGMLSDIDTATPVTPLELGDYGTGYNFIRNLLASTPFSVIIYLINALLWLTFIRWAIAQFSDLQ
jgi:hypothetical protein